MHRRPARHQDHHRARSEPDGRLRVKPRINLTAELADGVQLTVTDIGTGVGLSDADLFQPSDEEPTVIRAGDRDASRLRAAAQ